MKSHDENYVTWVPALTSAAKAHKPWASRARRAALLPATAMLCLLFVSGCHRKVASLTATRYGSTGLGENPLRGDLVPVHDPSLAREGSSWYAFTTDLPFVHAGTYLPIRCSQDGRSWSLCGHVFDVLPGWVTRKVPGVQGLWAPEVAYFSGVYHVYYAASLFGTQRSVIGLATNTTLDPHAPGYRWVDQGEVLASKPGDDFNAIDPSVLVLPPLFSASKRKGDPGPDPHGASAAWLTYGSFWSGIKQRRLDPNTGKLDPRDPQTYSLATQPRNRGRAIEGASLIERDGYYYLFASVGICCDIPIERDTYRQIVGRSRTVHGPFVGEDGSKLIEGGGTILLDSNSLWLAPGGGSLSQAPQTGETLLAFHALRRSENGALYLWIKRVDWQDGWPVLHDRD